MKRVISATAAALVTVLFSLPEGAGENLLSLPAPDREGRIALESLLQSRRSERTYSGESLALSEVAQLLWSAQGTSHPRGLRTAPSAGALYPLEVYLLAGQIDGLPAGIYRYLPSEHSLLPLSTGDRREPLAAAALSQVCVGEAAAVIVLSALYERTTGKYGERGRRYVHIEAGSAAQNISLQASSLGLGTVFIGAFDDAGVGEVIGLGVRERPLGLMPVGRKLPGPKGAGGR